MGSRHPHAPHSSLKVTTRTSCVQGIPASVPSPRHQVSPRTAKPVTAPARFPYSRHLYPPVPRAEPRAARRLGRARLAYRVRSNPAWGEKRIAAGQGRGRDLEAAPARRPDGVDGGGLWTEPAGGREGGIRAIGRSTLGLLRAGTRGLLLGPTGGWRRLLRAGARARPRPLATRAARRGRRLGGGAGPLRRRTRTR